MKSNVADEILQRSVDVKVGRRIYKVEPPTLATLIAVGDLVEKLPNVSQEEKAILWTLKNAKHARIIAQIVAVLVLGKAIDKKVVVRKSYFKELININRRVYMRDEIIEDVLDLSTDEIIGLVQFLLSKLDVGSFFFLITSLKEESLTKPTKTIQYGQ